MLTETIKVKYVYKPENREYSDDINVQLPENMDDLSMLKADIVDLACRQFKTDVRNKARVALQQANGHAPVSKRAVRETSILKAFAAIMTDSVLRVEYEGLAELHGPDSPQVRNYIAQTYDRIFS